MIKLNSSRPTRGSVHTTRIVSVVLIVLATAALFKWHDRIPFLHSRTHVVLKSLSSIGPVITDEAFLSDGNRICSRDLAYLSQYSERALVDAKGDQVAKLKNTKELADRARKLYPQVILFKVKKDNDRYSLMPEGWDSTPTITKRTRADIVIVGGELSSICTAIAAADSGFKVALVYGGPLGGLSSDDGGNLRYFDVMKTTSHPKCQKELWKAIKVLGFCALPDGVDERINNFLTTRYGKKIELVKTKDYDSLVADSTTSRVTSVTTAEGVVVSGDRFIDMDPESRLAEKCGIPMNTDTQHLSCGMVFDVMNLGTKDWDTLNQTSRVTPERIAAFAQVSLAEAAKNPEAAKSLGLLRAKIASNHSIIGHINCFGFPALAQGFDFYMKCRALTKPMDKDLRWVNQRRCVSGFNISLFSKGSVFNSISYKFKQSILQHSHNFKTDPIFQPIRKYDIPSIQKYLAWVTGNSRVKVEMPDQLYIRSASAFFEILHPYVKSEFNNKAQTAYHTYYPMDLRDLNPRDEYSWPIVMGMVKKAKYSHFWDTRPNATYTRISNLFLVNKSAVTPTFFGGQRIEGNQINMGAALIESFRKQ